MCPDLKPHAAYKDSGLPSLGRVPAHWALKRAKYFFREVDERSSTGDEELLSVSHLTGVTPRREKNVTMFLAESNVGHKRCHPRDLVINTMWAWMGALGVARQTGLVSPSYGVYRPFESSDLSPDYVDRLLRTAAYASEFTCRSTGVNSSRLRLYPEEFLRIPILCPPHAEQTAIVRYLDQVDRRIRRYLRVRGKLVSLLNEQRQAVIQRAVTRGLDPNVRLSDSGVPSLGEAPEHWGVHRLKTLVRRIDQGVSPQAENRLADDGSWGVLKSGCVNRGLFRESEHKRLPDEFTIDPRIAVHSGDVLVSRASGSPHLVGSVARVGQLTFQLLLSDKTFRLVFREGVEPDFMVCAMNSSYYRQQVEQAISGAEGLANNLQLSSLRTFSFAIPPTMEQRRVVHLARTVTRNSNAAVEHAEHEILLLREYRARLIADVVTGKLDVRDAAAHLPNEIDEELALDDIESLVEDEESGEGPSETPLEEVGDEP